MALSMSNSIWRWPSSRTRLCTQKKKPTRTPRVTGVTVCRLVAG